MKYLVYFNNGLVETNVMIVADSEEQATQLFMDEINSGDEYFLKNMCFGKCEYLRTVEVKTVDSILQKIVTEQKLDWITIEKEVTGLTCEKLRDLRNEVVQGYDKFRNQEVDKGRLSLETMDNLMLVTCVIDSEIIELGGDV